MGENRRATTGLRADAERNRTLIVDAAHEAFAAEGIDVSMAEIARRAGVGFATAQRRFPTKQALIAEVVRAQLAGISELSAFSHDTDAWEAFAAPIRACCDHQAQEPGLAGALAQILSAVSEPIVSEPFVAAFEQLAARAKAEGALRADITPDDVILIIKANAGVVTGSPGREVEASRRFVELALESMRGHV